MYLNFTKRIALISLACLLFIPTIQAQGNLPYVDDKPIHFGFLLGYNSMDFGVTNSMRADSASGKVYRAAVSTLQPGFSVGIISDLRLNRYLNLRFTPTLNFSSRILSYNTLGTSDSISVSSIPLNLPLLLKYSAERKNNYRPYLIWGCGVAVDMSAGTGKSKENIISLKPLNFYTEFGVGCDLYFSFFKLCPELKFAIGFNDLLDHNFVPEDPTKKIYTQAISRLTSHMLTLAFNFE